MYQTIQLSERISVQGETVQVLANGDVVIKDGPHTYRGRPIPQPRTPLATTAARQA